jgi:hypothetical protein
MPDGKKVRFPDDMSREDIKGFISQKYNQAPQFSEDALAQVKTNNEAYAQRQEENRPWVDKNPVARLGIAAMQGVANSGLNPAGYAARAAGMDTKPFTPQNAVERATELGAEYGFDAAALGGIGKIAQGAGYLGKGQGLASKVAQEVLAPENTTALLSKFVAPAVGGGMLEGAANPQTEVGKTLANIAGAGIVGGIEGGFRRTATNTAGGLKEALPNESANAALSKGVKADKEIARQISKDAPAVYNSLNDDMSQALDKAVGRKLDIERALDSQQQRYNDFIRRNADMELYSPKTPEQQAVDNFARWFEGSKVVDENGQPRRYYHGSLRNFDKFKQGNNDYNFSPDEKFAYNYAENKAFEQGIDAEPKVYEVFLKSKKPFDFENPKDIQNLSDYIGNKAIKVFGNPKEKNDFLSNLKGEYYDTDLRKGEFEKLFDENAFYPYNWYDGTNKIVDQTYSSMSDSRIFKVNPNEEYFIAGSLPYGYDIRDINKKQVEDAIKNLDFNKFKKQQIPVDIQTEYGNRVVNLDLKRIDKPSIKNLKKGGDNWVTIESADFDGEDLLDALKNMGYDGYYKQENGVKNLSVFNPNQIKSVNNSGAWSSSPSLSDAGWTPKASLKNFTDGLDQFQTNALDQAIEKGSQMSTHAKGTLGATHRAQEVLNDMIDASYDTSVIGKKKPTTETRELMKVKERLNQILEPSGVKPYDAGISKAKSLDYFKEQGYNFKPSETKFENLGLETLRDRRAFLQGRLAKIKDNVLSDGGTNLATAVKKDENTLRKLMSKDKFDTLMNKANSIEESFKRLKSIEGQADKELLKEIERNGSPWRENIESKGSMLGRAADVLTGWYGRNARKNLANAYLNPETQFITRRGGLLGMLKGSTAADTRQLMIDLLNGGN